MSETESFGIMGRPTAMAALVLGPTILGLFCYIWAFWSQSHNLGLFKEFFTLSCVCKESQLRGVQNVYGCLMSFLFSDVVNAAFAITFGILILLNSCDDEHLLVCAIVSNIWLSFRYFSLAEHFITALISALYVRHPSWGKGLRYTSRFLLMLAYLFVIMWFRVSDIFLMILNGYKVLLIVATVWVYFSSLAAPAAGQMKAIVLIAVITFLFICLPNFVIDCYLMKSWNEELKSDLYHNISVNILYVTNFQIFMNGLMCYFVLKLNTDDEQRERECEGAIGPI